MSSSLGSLLPPEGKVASRWRDKAKHGLIRVMIFMINHINYNHTHIEAILPTVSSPIHTADVELYLLTSPIYDVMMTSCHPKNRLACTWQQFCSHGNAAVRTAPYVVPSLS